VFLGSRVSPGEVQNGFRVEARAFRPGEEVPTMDAGFSPGNLGSPVTTRFPVSPGFGSGLVVRLLLHLCLSVFICGSKVSRPLPRDKSPHHIV
jgi:hypothetical protein